ncbi:MAG TPA: histidine kinase [Microscillaceae bacterium]|nr:histidine kinase [Microscillaceae bacterium]
MRKFFIQSLLLWIIFPLSLVAQQHTIPLHQLTTSDGLSQGYVYTTFQDSQGFIWFGTRDGLNRYDGYEFKIYRNISDDSCSLGNQVVFAIAEDKQGKLWLGTVAGLYQFDPRTECFKHFPDAQNSGNAEVISIFIDAQNLIWLGMYHTGLKMFDPTTQRFVAYPKKGGNFFQIQEDFSRRHLWLMSTNEGQRVDLFDKKQGKFVAAEYSMEVMTQSKAQIVQNKNGRAYIYQLGKQKDEMIRFNPITKHKYSFRVPRSRYQSAHADYAIFSRKDDFYIDANETLWQTTPGGIIRFDLRKQKFVAHYRFKVSGIIRNIGFRVDRSGLVWINTIGDGVYVFNPNGELIQNFSPSKNNPHGLGFKGVRTIYEDRQKRLWVGGYTGLDVFENGSQKAVHFAEQIYQHNPLPAGLNVETMHEDTEGQLWLGIYMIGLRKTNYLTHQFVSIVPKDTIIPVMSVMDIENDREPHTLWLATLNGLQKLNTRTQVVTFYQHQTHSGLPPGAIFALFRDREGTLWVGSEQGGFARFNPGNQTFTQFKHQTDKANSLSHNTVYAFHEDRAGNFWIATGGGGLNLFDRKKQRFWHYTEKDGLANNVINGILEDDKGNLWLSTNRGISKFDPVKKTFTNFDERDGLQANEFNRHAFCKGKDGKMYFGGVNGVSAFYPQNLKKNTFVPPVVITKFKKLNQEIPLHRLMSPKQELVLSHKDAIISFEFAALNFYQSDKNQYAYKLEGLHDEWIQLNTQREIVFPSLASGKYTLKVKASNNAGVWNEEGITLKIRVTPPWWATPWFRLGVVLLIVLAIVTGYSWRLRQARQKRRQLEQLVDERTSELKKLNHTKDRFFGIVAHDLRGPLAAFHQSMYLLDYHLKNKELDAAQSISYQIALTSKKLNGLLNNLLDWAMIQQKSVSHYPKHLSLYQLVEDCLTIYQGSIDLHHIQIQNKVPSHQLLWADAHSITSVIQNLLGNAIKFTPDYGKIEINTHYQASDLVLSISDSGVGMNTDSLTKIFDDSNPKTRKGIRGEQGVGLGLKLCQEFTYLNQATLTANSTPGEGTTFYVTFQNQLSKVKEESNKSN